MRGAMGGAQVRRARGRGGAEGSVALSAPGAALGPSWWRRKGAGAPRSSSHRGVGSFPKLGPDLEAAKRA